MHTGELKIASALSDAGTLAEELKDFQRKVSDAGRATYAARIGAHDDSVLSVAIALSWAMSGCRNCGFNREYSKTEKLRWPQ